MVSGYSSSARQNIISRSQKQDESKVYNRCHTPRTSYVLPFSENSLQRSQQAIIVPQKEMPGHLFLLAHNAAAIASSVDAPPLVKVNLCNVTPEMVSCCREAAVITISDGPIVKTAGYEKPVPVGLAEVGTAVIVKRHSIFMLHHHREIIADEVWRIEERLLLPRVGHSHVVEVVKMNCEAYSLRTQCFAALFTSVSGGLLPARFQFYDMRESPVLE